MQNTYNEQDVENLNRFISDSNCWLEGYVRDPETGLLQSAVSLNAPAARKECYNIVIVKFQLTAGGTVWGVSAADKAYRLGTMGLHLTQEEADELARQRAAENETAAGLIDTLIHLKNTLNKRKRHV